MAQALAVMKDLAASPHTAHHVALKLARHFVADDPPPALVARLQRTFQGTGGDLGEVAKTLVLAPEAWSPDAAKFKTPYEFVVSAWRAAGVSPSALPQAAILNTLGQKPFSAPSPKGWPEEAEVWCAPDAVIKRMAWAQQLAAQSLNGRDPVQMAHDALGARLTRSGRCRHPAGRNPRGGPRHPLDVPGVPTPMTRKPMLGASALDLPSRRQALAGALGLGLSIEFLGRKAFAAADGVAREPQADRGDLPRRHGRPFRVAAGWRSQLRGPARPDRHPRLRRARRGAEARRHLRPAPVAGRRHTSWR